MQEQKNLWENSNQPVIMYGCPEGKLVALNDVVWLACGIMPGAE